MATTTNDPSIQNTDVDNASPKGGSASKSSGEYRAPVRGEATRVAKWHRKIKLARAFDENVRKMYARDRRYARGETGMDVSYSLIQAYIDIMVAFLVARNPDYTCEPAENVGQAGLQDAEAYGKTMEIVVRHLLSSAKLKRKAERWVRSAITVGIGVLKATWQEVWGEDPHMKGRMRDAQKNVADIKALLEQIKAGEAGDIDEAMGRLNDLQMGLANRAEVMIAAGMALDVIRPEDMVYGVDGESIVDTDEISWLGNRYFIDAEDAPGEFTGLDPACLGSAAKYAPRKPADRMDKEAKYNGVVAQVDASESDAYVKGGESKLSTFLCAWEIWDNDSNMFFTLIEGVSDRYANPPAQPPCPTTKFDPYFILSFTEVDGERHPQSLVSRGARLQDEIERAMSDFITHRKRVKPKLGFDASKVTRDTVKRLENGTTEEYVAIKLLGGAAENSDLRKVLFPIAYSVIDMALYDTQPQIRALETVFGIQEALAGTVQIAKTATEAEIQQAGTNAKTTYKRDVLEERMSELANYSAECAAYRLARTEVQAIAGPQSYWIEFAAPEDVANMIKIDVKAGSTGKPDNAARREAWGMIQPQLMEMMGTIADLRQTPPPMLANNIEELLLETAERLGEQLNAVRFVPQAPEQPIINPMTGLPATNSELGAIQAAQQAPPPGGKPPGAPAGNGAQPPPQAPADQPPGAPPGP